MLSICTTIKNRSRVTVDERQLILFPNCVRSLVASAGPDVPCELVVTDWRSDDWPLAKWLEQTAAPLSVRLLTLDGPFSRGRGLNLAANAAGGSVLFFIDADVLLCPEVIRHGLKHVREGRAFFPVFFSFDDPQHSSGSWIDYAYGQCMVSRAHYEASGGWPEYDCWGKEDDDFHARLKSLVEVVRENVPGFCHQWHPTDLEWKDQYSARAPIRQREKQQLLQAVPELLQFVPHGERVILVDEARFGNHPVSEFVTVPFLEHDGEYWGLPADDAVAVAELERLRQDGARYIAFAWVAHWWLEHYTGFHEYLRSTYRQVLASEQFVLFDLRERN